MLMLRTITPADITQLVQLEEASQIAPWAELTFQHCFSAGGLGWGIEEQGIFSSFILILIQAGEAHILNVCVHPAYQHQGQGRRLMLHVLEFAKERSAGIAYLEVRVSNRKAISLYEQLGFRQVGERKNYYTSPSGFEDALIFAKDLQAG